MGGPDQKPLNHEGGLLPPDGGGAAPVGADAPPVADVAGKSWPGGAVGAAAVLLSGVNGAAGAAAGFLKPVGRRLVAG